MVSMKQIIFLLFLLVPFLSFGQTEQFYDNLGRKAEGKMADGLQTGVWKVWDKEGHLESTGAYTIISKSSVRIRFISDGCPDTLGIIKEIKQQMHEKYSVETGKWDHYLNGKIESTGTYVPMGIIDVGCLSDIDADGNSTGKVNHVYGLPVGAKTGLWNYYDETGKIISVDHYEVGKLILEK